jgi:spermidine/putrescine transport system substrate-binding protein
MIRHAKLWNRIAVVAIACLAIALPAACSEPAAPTGAAGAQEEAQAEADSLTILDWAGYDAPEFWTKFAEAYPDAEVNYTYFEQDADALAKLQSGFQVDLAHPCSSWWGLYVDAGLVQPIDTSRLKNWPDVAPELAKLGEFDGQQYFVPWDWGYESILVRTDKVEEIPASWADLWNPAYAGRLSIPDSAEVAQVIAAVALGIPNPWQTTPEEDALIKQKLSDIKPNVLTYWIDATELSQMVASGDVWVAAGVWTDTYSQLLADDVPVEYIEPAEGRLGWVCGYGISSNAQAPDLAYAYLDAILDPEASANLSNQFFYGTSNRESFDLVDPALVSLFKLDQPEVLQQTVFYQTMSAEHRRKITEMWDEVRLAP